VSPIARHIALSAASVGLVLSLGAARAQQPAPSLEKPPTLQPLPEVPPGPSGAPSTNDSAPVITIRQEGANRIEEYRVNGHLYAIRVTPKGGVPYTMVDPDGSGKMVLAASGADDPAGRSVKPPRWVLFKF